jgi:hypothetical protein
MSDENKPAANERNTVSYPQKYWWLILVLLPVALALIQNNSRPAHEKKRERRI